MANDVGLPEQAADELRSFLDGAKVLNDMKRNCETADGHLMAQGLAMQQAAILPPNFDLEVMIQQAGIQIGLEGLL